MPREGRTLKMALWKSQVKIAIVKFTFTLRGHVLGNVVFTLSVVPLLTLLSLLVRDIPSTELEMKYYVGVQRLMLLVFI